MPAEDTFIINVDTKTGQVSLDKLQKKINSIYGGINKLSSTKDIPTKGITRYTIEITKAKKKVDELAKANRALQASYPRNITGVTSRFSAARARVNRAVAAAPAAAAATTPMPIYGTGRAARYPLIPSQPFNVPNLTKAQNAATLAGLKNALASGANKKMLYSNNRVGNANIQWIPTGSAKFIPSPVKQTNGLMDKFNKNLKSLTKQTFMLQMGMLGVAFSSQSLIYSLQGLASQTLTGLADTESAIQNAVLSQVFGTDVMGGLGLDIDTIVESSLKARGVLADLNSILVLIAAKVFADPAVMKAITESIQLITAKLSDDKFVQSLKDVVIEIAKAAPKLIDILPPLADLIKNLGEAGLLDKIILLVGACLLLMPLFASLQLLLIVIASPEILGAILGGLAILIFLFTTARDIIARVNEVIEILKDPLNNITNIFGLLYDALLFILPPLKSFVDVINSIMGLVSGKSSITEAGSNIAGSMLSNSPVGAVYNIVFQKSVGSQNASEVQSAIKSTQSRTYG